MKKSLFLIFLTLCAMKRRSFLIVYNPTAGNKRSSSILKRIETFYKDHDIPYFIYKTSINEFSHCGISQLITDEKFTDILSVGGDGTLNTVVNENINHQLPVSVVPIGTGNDFSKNLNIGKDLIAQLNTSINGKIKWIDVGLCNDRYFLNGMGIGFDGRIAHLLKKRSFFQGSLAYLLTVFLNLANYKELPLTFSLDKRKFERRIFLLTIGNGTTFGGGFKVTPSALLDDGYLDICLIEKIPPFRRFIKLIQLRTGNHHKLREVTFFKSKEIEIKSATVFTHMDGEPLNHPPYMISILPKKIPVRTNQLSFN